MTTTSPVERAGEPFLDTGISLCWAAAIPGNRASSKEQGRKWVRARLGNGRVLEKDIGDEEGGTFLDAV